MSSLAGKVVTMLDIRKIIESLALLNFVRELIVAPGGNNKQYNEHQLSSHDSTPTWKGTLNFHLTTE